MQGAASHLHQEPNESAHTMPLAVWSAAILSKAQGGEAVHALSRLQQAQNFMAKIDKLKRFGAKRQKLREV